jgi:hypothetical protein
LVRRRERAWGMVAYMQSDETENKIERKKEEE